MNDPTCAPSQDPNRYALLIGVNKYTNLNGEDLEGCVNDVHAWYSMALQLGTPPENIVILTSPSLSHGDLGAVNGRANAPALGSADKESVDAQLKKIIDLAKADSAREVLVFYAGHGAHDTKSLLLCPSDTERRGGKLKSVVSFGDILDYIGPEQQRGLTFVLDACYSGGAAASEDEAPMPTTRSLANVRLSREKFNRIFIDQIKAVSSQVLIVSACEAKQEAYEYSLRVDMGLKKVVHGILTTAVSAVVQRWDPPDTGTSGQTFNITYDTLVDRAGRYAHALAFDQTPTLAGPEGCETWLAFQNFQAGSPTPAPQIPGRELSGDTMSVILGGITGAGGASKGFFIQHTDDSGATSTTKRYLTGKTPQASDKYDTAFQTADMVGETYKKPINVAAGVAPGSSTPLDVIFYKVSYFDASANPFVVGFMIGYPGTGGSDPARNIWLLNTGALESRDQFKLDQGYFSGFKSYDKVFDNVALTDVGNFSTNKLNYPASYLKAYDITGDGVDGGPGYLFLKSGVDQYWYNVSEKKLFSVYVNGVAKPLTFTENTTGFSGTKGYRAKDTAIV